MLTRYLFNPFTAIAGAKSFTIGAIGFLATTFLAHITGTHFYGILNIDFYKGPNIWIFLIEGGSHWIILSALLFFSGIILSKSKIRAIDVFGTILLSRLPFLLLPALRTVPYFQSFAFYSIAMFVVIIIYIILLVWVFILMFNAYRISCNLKNERLIASFIFCVLIAEILTKVIIWKLT